ncbi:isopentenyl transferase family protein [Streptomyces sp. NPDC003393]
MTTYATQLQAAGAAVTVLSAEKTVTHWAERYVGPWWQAAPVEPDSVCAGPLVVAEVDTEKYGDAALAVTQTPHRSTTYAKARTLVADSGEEGVIAAVSPGELLAYRSEPASGRLTVYGCEPETVATATARLAREVMRGVLLRDGWAVLHASAVVKDSRVVLTFGAKGAGKTTTALALAARHGWGLLANDRVFVRPNGQGGVDVLPWPSAAALGLGLLDALDWFETARERLKGGEALHPTQDTRVTDALIAGDRTPLWEKGKELKVQVLPDQFPRWFSVPLATGGEAAALVFPRIDADAAPAVSDDCRGLDDHDFMTGETEDRYPDIFELARVDGGGTEEARHEVAHLLAALPHHSVVLGHDVTAHADFLTQLVDLPAS